MAIKYKCPECGNTSFECHRIVEASQTIVLGGDGDIEDEGDIEETMNEGDPQGPYTCTECGEEFEELPEKPSKKKKESAE